jgi:serine/threonine-protein kinase RsbW
MNYKCKIGCKIDNLREVRDFVRDTLKHHGISEIEVSEMVLALDEMCSNLMIHAHHCNPDDLVEIKINIQKGRPVIFEIYDDGTVFDINTFTEPSINEIVNEKRKGGLGIRLVKSIMDQVEYLRGKDKNVCRLTKKVKHR